MDNKGYGVELTLVIDKFKKKMQEVQQIANEFSSKVKNDFNTGLYLDTKQAQTDLEKVESDLEALKTKMDGLQQDKVWGFTVDDSIKETEKQISQVEGRISDLKADIKTVSTSPFAKLGQAMANVKQAIKGIDFKKVFNNLQEGTKKAVEGFKKLRKESSKSGMDIQKGMKKATNILRRFSLSLFGIQSIWRAVSKASSAYLSYDSELQKSIQQTWAGLGSFLAPVLEYVVRLFQQFLAYTNAVVKALTGIDFVARANAKSLKNQAKQAGKTAKALAGFDELTNLNQQQEAPQIELPDTDAVKVDGILDVINKAKEIIATVFEPIISAWENTKPKLIPSILNSFEGISSLLGSVLGSVFEVWTNGTGEKVVSNQIMMFTKLFDIIGELGNVLSEAWTQNNSGTIAIQSVADTFASLQEIILSIGTSLSSWVMSESFQTAITMLIQVISNLFSYISEISTWLVEMYNTYLKPMVDSILLFVSDLIVGIGVLWNFLKPVLDTIIKTLMNVLEPAIKALSNTIKSIIDALRGVIDFVVGVFTGDWQLAFNGLVSFIDGIVDAIGWLFGGLFETIDTALRGAVNIIVSAFSVLIEWFKTAIIDPLAGLFIGVWNGVTNGAKDAWKGIQNVFSGVGTFFKNTFTNAWTAVKNVFSTGGKIFDGIKDGIVNAFKTIVNGLIDGINKVVSTPFNAINSMLNTIRNTDVLGVKPFKGLWKQNPIGVPKIPKLSVGTDNVKSEGLAYLHAGEKVVPADVVKGGYTGGDNTETNNLLRELIQALEDKQFSASIKASDIGEASIDYIKRQNRIMGGSVI